MMRSIYTLAAAVGLAIFLSHFNFTPYQVFGGGLVVCVFVGLVSDVTEAIKDKTK